MRSEVKRNEVHIFDEMCVLSWTSNCAICMWVTVQYVLLSHCLIALCFTSCALCYVLIIFFLCFFYSFYVCFLVFYVLLSILCDLFFCNVLCIVSPDVYNYFIFVYNFTDHCHRVETQLQLINIISYRIIS